jgi:short-subunit dehydrogenase
MPTALVTGASRGLGAVFADRLARDGMDLVLVARDRAGLERTAAAARRYGVTADVLVADLSTPAGRAVVENRVASPYGPVAMLVNNASVENSDVFVEADLHDLQSQIDTNITAVMSLTHAALPGMIARGTGSVINVASFAGYLPTPGSTYASTKAWVLAFTDTMAASLPGTGVGMIALCPGRMRTGKHDAPATPSPLWLDPAAVVDQCLRDLRHGRTLCTPGWLYRSVVGVLEAPRRSMRAAARLAGRGRAQRSTVTKPTITRSAPARPAA